MPEAYLGLDIGGTKLAVGLAERGGKLLGMVGRATDRQATPADFVRVLAQMAGEVCNRVGAEPAAAGISYGGPVDYGRQVTVTCHHLEGWEGIPLTRMMGEALGLERVVMDNDGNACALGEARFGAGQGHSELLYLTVSSGIGGGVILGGRVYRGATSMAGEIGHTVIVPGGPECTCGRQGCLEALASGWSIARRAREALAAGAGPGSRLYELGPEPSAQVVAEQANAGDPLAAALMAETAGYLALGVAAAVNLLNPTLVVIGGGVGKAGDCLFAPLRRAVDGYALAENAAAVSIVPAALGDAGGVLGAVALALE
jgi:glucokinase